MHREGPVRVLIVDDNAFVREGLAAIIGQQPDMQVAGEAANGQEAIDTYACDRPDVTLMDLRMPVMDGISATETICSRDPQARILLLTTFPDMEQIAIALQAGARGYLLKDADRAELLQAIYSLVVPTQGIDVSSPVSCSGAPAE